MRDDFLRYREVNARIAVVVRDDAESLAEYWAKEKLPYIGIPDSKARLGDLYGQQWKASRLGLMPALFIVDTQGRIAYSHYSDGMSDIPENDVVITILTNLIASPSSDKTEK